MKIVYVLPGPMGRSEAGRAEMERRLTILRSYAAPGTEVDIADVDEGPASIESLYEEYRAFRRRSKGCSRRRRRATTLPCSGATGIRVSTR